MFILISNQLNIGLNHLKYFYDDDRVNDLLFNLQYSKLSFIEAKKILRKYYSQDELKGFSLMINKVKSISKLINEIDSLNVDFFEFTEALKSDDLEKLNYLVKEHSEVEKKDPLRYMKNKIFRNAAYHSNSINKEKKIIQTKHKENCFTCKSLLISEKILKQFEHNSNDQELNLTVEEDTILENQTNKEIVFLLNRLLQELNNKNKNINFVADQLIKNKFQECLTLYDRKIDEIWKSLIYGIN